MDYALLLLEIELIEQEEDLTDNIRLQNSCDNNYKYLFKSERLKNRSNISSLKRAIQILKSENKP